MNILNMAKTDWKESEKVCELYLQHLPSFHSI